MTSREFTDAVRLAFSPGFSYLGHDFSDLEGCQLRDFVPVMVTIETVAACIKYHAMYMDGGVDQAELANMKYAFCTAKRVQLITRVSAAV